MQAVFFNIYTYLFTSTDSKFEVSNTSRKSTFSISHKVVPLAHPPPLARARHEPVRGDGGQPPLEGPEVLVSGGGRADQVRGGDGVGGVAAAEAELGSGVDRYC